MTLAAFDANGFSLAPGIRLLEASAGTGKTFALAHLVLRLLSEGRRPLEVEELLVVTFGVAPSALRMVSILARDWPRATTSRGVTRARATRAAMRAASCTPSIASKSSEAKRRSSTRAAGIRATGRRRREGRASWRRRAARSRTGS